MSSFNSANFFEDNDDLRFYIEKYIEWEPLVELTEFDFRARDGFTDLEEALDVYRRILEMVGDFAANEIAPRAALRPADSKILAYETRLSRITSAATTVAEKISAPGRLSTTCNAPASWAPTRPPGGIHRSPPHAIGP